MRKKFNSVFFKNVRSKKIYWVKGFDMLQLCRLKYIIQNEMRYIL